jgi:hypothetical protein
MQTFNNDIPANERAFIFFCFQPALWDKNKQKEKEKKGQSTSVRLSILFPAGIRLNNESSIQLQIHLPCPSNATSPTRAIPLPPACRLAHSSI